MNEKPELSKEAVGSGELVRRVYPKLKGWWEEYHCGCVSETTRRKKDLLGYCKIHGNDRRQIFPDIEAPNDPDQRPAR